MKKKKGVSWIFVNSVNDGVNNNKAYISFEVYSTIFNHKTNEKTKNRLHLVDFSKYFDFFKKQFFAEEIIFLFIIYIL